MEKFLFQTLESLCNIECLPYLEIIVIDDGSSDKTLSIAKQFEEKYPDSFIVVHKKNGGWGSTVNYSIKNASGKYYRLLDGDDYFEKENLSDLINILKIINDDIVFTPYRKFTNQSNEYSEIQYADSLEYNRTYTVDEIYDKVDLPMHVLTFRTDLLKNNNVTVLDRFFYTDNEFRIKGIAYAKTIYITDILIYNYRIGREGQSIDISGLQKHSDDYFYVIKELFDFYSLDSVTHIKKILSYFIKNSIDTYYSILIVLGQKEAFVSFDEFLKKIDINFYSNVKQEVKLIRKNNYALFNIVSEKSKKYVK